MSLLTRNVLYNLIGQILLTALSLVAVKVVFRSLGGDAIGIIFAATTLATVLTATLDLGFSATTVRQVSAHSLDEPVYIRRLIQTASLFYWLTYLLLAIGAYAIAPYLAEEWIHLESLPTGIAVDALRVLGIGALSALPRSLYVSALRGLQRMAYNNIIDVAVSAMQQVGTLVVVGMGFGIVGVAYWFAICFALGMAAYLFTSARFLGWRALVPRMSVSVIRRNYGFSSSMVLISFLAPIHAQADRILVSKALPFDRFGYYALTSRIVGSGTLPAVAVAQAALPSLSALARNADRGPLLAQYRKLHDALSLGMVPVFAAIAFGAMPVLSLVLDPQIAGDLLIPALILCVGYYMNATVQIPYVFSLAVGRPRITARLNLTALVAVLPLTALLVFRLGLVGAAMSWIAYYLWTYIYWVPKVCAECLHTAPWEWYRHVLRIAALAASTYGLAFLIAMSLGQGKLVFLVGAYLIGSALYLFGARSIIDPDLVTTIRRQLPTAIERVLSRRGAGAR